MLLGVTLGDAAGIGPEIVLKAFRDGAMPWRFVVIGDLSVLDYANDTLGFGVPLSRVTTCQAARDGAFNVLDLGRLPKNAIVPGAVSAASGQAAYQYLLRGIDEARAGHVNALVTLPMNKEATRLTVPDFSGHTDVIAQAAGCRHYTMTLISPRFIVTHVTAHAALRVAIDMIHADRVFDVIRLTDQAARRLGRPARMAVMGLNPHAGEDGAFGDEERRHIRPAVERARGEGFDAVGPLPPDTVFMRALKGDFSSIVCMYHDQGHIPMKMLGFEETVNVTAGLPFVRTSVDHGTAFDIAYRGVASTGSFLKACEMAVQLTLGPGEPHP